MIEVQSGKVLVDPLYCDLVRFDPNGREYVRRILPAGEVCIYGTNSHLEGLANVSGSLFSDEDLPDKITALIRYHHLLSPPVAFNMEDKRN